jgi:hypothetical protein
LVQNTKTGKIYQNSNKMYQMAIRYTKWLSNIPNDHKIYQQFPFQGPPKYTQIWIFGLKTYHLATLLPIWYISQFWECMKKVILISEICFFLISVSIWFLGCLNRKDFDVFDIFLMQIFISRLFVQNAFYF